MSLATRWPRAMVVVGLAAMVVGAVDPLEGSVVVLPGMALVALGAQLGHSRHRVLIYWSLVLVAAGVGALSGLSSIGGFGGSSGRSNWWALALLPYPVGWIMGLVGAARRLREPPPPVVA
jgi:hypothetical protein